MEFNSNCLIDMIAFLEMKLCSSGKIVLSLNLAPVLSAIPRTKTEKVFTIFKY